VFVVVVAALAFAPVVFGQTDARAAQVLAMSRKAIGDKKLDALKTLSVEAVVQRNLGPMQMSADAELLLELPDKYARTDVPNTPGMVVSGMANGFNGDKPLQPARGAIPGAPGMPAGAMVIRMGGAGSAPADAPKLSPDEQAKLDTSLVRGQQHELSRLMLGWFAMTHPTVAAQYTFAGEAESPDGRAFVIDVKADGFAARLFVDQETHLPLMVTYRGAQRQVVTMNRGPEGGGHSMGTAAQGTPDAPKQPALVDYSLFFEDWQPVDGVKFPRKIRRASEDATTEEWTIGKVKINPAIDAKKFAVKN
jgi:hypothetical protein